MFIIPTLIRPKDANAKSWLQALMMRKSEGPKKSKYSDTWFAESANPWKFRDSWGFDGTESAAWTVSTSEDWWAAVWSDIVSEHGERDALKFWRAFNQVTASNNRAVAIQGIVSANWSGAKVAYNSARHEAYAKEIGATGEHLRRCESEEMATAMKRNLGAWLYDAIRNGEHGQLRNLAHLVSGKLPPDMPELRGDDKTELLTAFAVILTSRFRLPQKEELFSEVTKTGNFSNNLRLLGLNSLPG